MPPWPPAGHTLVFGWPIAVSSDQGTGFLLQNKGQRTKHQFSVVHMLWEDRCRLALGQTHCTTLPPFLSHLKTHQMSGTHHGVTENRPVVHVEGKQDYWS